MAMFSGLSAVRVRKWAGDFGIPIGLYIFAAAILVFNLNTHPNYTYNWENNTLQGLYRFVDQPSLGPFKLLEGLMTDSINSPWTILPAWITFGLTGPSLIALRLPIALIAALAVPLLYLVSRTMLEGRDQKSDARSTLTALVAALLLALSPVYILYSRTATVVGVSLVPALLTMLALFGVLRRPDLWWRSAAVLGTLMLGAYAYAPIRFLWPMCVVVLLIEAFMRRKISRRSPRRLVASALLLVVGMVGFITALDFEHEHNPLISLGYYYSGRGEQIANLIVNVDMYNNMTGPVVPAIAPPVEQLAWDLFTRNVADMTNLFLDIDTQPALSDYWNPHGRLIPWWLAPLLLIGLLRATWLGFWRHHYRWRIAVLFFLGFTLPMLLTSQVHIGRLIFAVPFICLFAAFGLASVSEVVGHLMNRSSQRSSLNTPSAVRGTKISLSILSVLLIASVAYSTWRDYTIEVPLTYEAAVTRLLRARLDLVHKRGGGAVLVNYGDDKLNLESINANQYRLMMRTEYHLFNLATGDVDIRRPGDTRPALYIGGMMEGLKEPQNIPDYCKNVYFVAPALEASFKVLVGAHPELCAEKIEYRLLP